MNVMLGLCPINTTHSSFVCYALYNVRKNVFLVIFFCFKFSFLFFDFFISVGFVHILFWLHRCYFF